MSRGLTVLCAAKLHKNQLERHLELFESVPEVSKVVLVRREPLDGRLSKLENRSFLPGPRPIEMMRLSTGVLSAAREQPIDWVIGFNPVPWGTLACLAARTRGIKTCLSLIGMDYLQIQKPWGRPFLQMVRLADAVTVTGLGMKNGLAQLGVDERRIHILPHSVDLNRFAPGDGNYDFDIVAVGQLIRRKRLDVLLDAVSILKSRGQRVRVGILGRGPLENELRSRAEKRGIAPDVEFLGYRDDVESVLKRARVFCLVSEWEGVPFALMEAMATGLVPVMTRVGTIEDWVMPGRTGFLVPVGEPPALSEALSRALGPEGILIQKTLLEERSMFGFAEGAAAWRRVFNLAPPQPSQL